MDRYFLMAHMVDMSARSMIFYDDGHIDNVAYVTYSLWHCAQQIDWNCLKFKITLRALAIFTLKSASTPWLMHFMVTCECLKRTREKGKRMINYLMHVNCILAPLTRLSDRLVMKSSIRRVLLYRFHTCRFILGIHILALLNWNFNPHHIFVSLMSHFRSHIFTSPIAINGHYHNGI